MATDPLSGIIDSTDGMAKALNKTTLKASRAGAEIIRKEVYAALKRRNRERFGRTRGKVTIELRSYGRTTTVGRAGESAGAMAIINDGAKPHTIKRGFGRKKPMKHPGADPTYAWDVGIRAARAQVDDDTRKAIDVAMEDGF